MNSKFDEHQHGFVKSRFTVSNLVIANEFITGGMEGHAQVDAVYIDYSKFFDLINHNVLIKKLMAASIRGDLLRWFVSYVNNRSQAVFLCGFMSRQTTDPSGVQLGSVLGPYYSSPLSMI